MAAMLDGVVDRLCHGDHDVPVDVVVELVLILRVVDETFDHPDILRKRGDVDADILHEVLPSQVIPPCQCA